jgi:hypothetical protein
MEVPVSSAHVHPHTDASTTAVVEHTIEPRPRFVPVFFASWLTWLGEGKVDRQDEPTLLQVMAIIKEGGGGTWVAGPPVALQKGSRRFSPRSPTLAASGRSCRRASSSAAR